MCTLTIIETSQKRHRVKVKVIKFSLLTDHGKWRAAWFPFLICTNTTKKLTTLSVSTHHCHTPHKCRVLSHQFMETSGLHDDWRTDERQQERKTGNRISSSNSCSGSISTNPPGNTRHHAIITQNTQYHGTTFFYDYVFWLARHICALFRISDS
jgi:hypothetical protein